MRLADVYKFSVSPIKIFKQLNTCIRKFHRRIPSCDCSFLSDKSVSPYLSLLIAKVAADSEVSCYIHIPVASHVLYILPITDTEIGFVANRAHIPFINYTAECDLSLRALAHSMAF